MTQDTPNIATLLKSYQNRISLSLSFTGYTHTQHFLNFIAYKKSYTFNVYGDSRKKPIFRDIPNSLKFNRTILYAITLKTSQHACETTQ